MIGQNYFKRRSGNLYRYCFIKYMSGSGLLVAENVRTEVTWELSIGINGHIILLLTSDFFINDMTVGHKFIKFTLDGISSDHKWIINTKDLTINLMSFSDDKNVYHCSVDNLTIMHSSHSELSRITKIKAHLMNFSFIGTQIRKSKNHLKRDSFSCSPFGDPIQFFERKDIKQLKELIQEKRLSYSVLSYLVLKKIKGQPLGSILEKIESITWFLSLINLNSNFCPLMEFYVGNQVICKKFHDIIKHPFHNSVLIDNLHIPTGIPNIFDTCFSTYQKINQKIEFNGLINHLAELQRQPYLDFKLAMLIMSYEYLTSMYLKELGIDPQKIQKSNIQQKLSMLNKTLKLIPKKLNGDFLRDSIRNPLFHQGTIPFLTFDEKWNYFVQYHDLLIQIILRILGYSGRYLSRINYEPQNVGFSKK